jgi:integrase
MESVAKYPYMTTRKGSKNLYYKRPVAPELREVARRHAEAAAARDDKTLPSGKAGSAQIWRSLGTADRKQAELKYAAIHKDVEDLLEEWRRELQGLPATVADVVEPDTVPLTGPLARRILDRWTADLIEADFRQRGEFWDKAKTDHDAFWRGEVLELPHIDPFFAFLSEDGERPLEHTFLYVLNFHRRRRLENVSTLHKLGDCKEHRAALVAVLAKQGIRLSDTDMLALSGRVMIAEIETLEKLVKADAVDVPQIEEAPPPAAAAAPVPAKPGVLMKDAVREYIRESLREKEWTKKDEMRFKAHLDEFMEIAGNKPVNQYAHTDGAEFKSIQLRLPRMRHGGVFKGKSLKECAALADKQGQGVKRLSPTAIKDKIGCVSRFFVWARGKDLSVIDPLKEVTITSPKKRNRGKGRLTWSIEELNRMFAAPIYTGARSASNWKTPGETVLNDTAMYWAPLIALFSGMRLGEIIQLHVADVREEHGIHIFDVTTLGSADEGANAKSVKTSTSHRKVPVHLSLIDLGLLNFVERQSQRGYARLFPDFEKSKDDDTWSKAFGKHFKRFRDSLTVEGEFRVRDKVDFHSLRHNVEDALRNANVRKEVRDAVQGHGENGVSAEYGSGYYVETLNEAVQTIRYAGLALPPRCGIDC